MHVASTQSAAYGNVPEASPRLEPMSLVENRLEEEHWPTSGISGHIRFTVHLHVTKRRIDQVYCIVTTWGIGETGWSAGRGRSAGFARQHLGGGGGKGETIERSLERGMKRIRGVFGRRACKDTQV